MWSTSLNFDPSILELLLAYEADASLYVVDEFDVGRIWRFTLMISTVRPDLLQITPAVLALFSVDFLRELFGKDSPVKNLLIGGDTFPSGLVLKYARDCSAQIYNVYGLTEVSCWASCTRFDPKR
jgi:acyl-CoA synthetase